MYSGAGAVLAESGLAAAVVLGVVAEMRAAATSVFAYDHDTVYQLVRGAGDDGRWARALRGYGEVVLDAEPAEYERRVRAGELAVVKMAICEDEATIQRTCPPPRPPARPPRGRG